MLDANHAARAGGQAPELVCILCHGYGAPGDDLVGIGAAVLDVAPALAGRVAFAFPEAPQSIPGMPSGRAWFQIDVARFGLALATGDLEQLFDDVPDGLAEARKALTATVHDVARKLSLPMSRVVLGGFSQGSMVATEVALRLEDAPAALAILSGTLLNRAEWAARAAKRTAMPVLQSHGTEDPILPYLAAVALRDMLTKAGVAVDFVSFRGGHGIAPNAIHKLAALLSSTLAKLASSSPSGAPPGASSGASS